MLKRRLQGAGQLVDALVAVVGGGDDVEALGGLDLVVQLGDRQRLLREDRDQRVLHVGGMRVSSSTRAILPSRIARIIGLGHERVARTGPRPAAGRSSSRSGSPPRRCRRCPGRAASSRRRSPRPGARETQRLGRAGHAEQQQRAVGGERGDGDLDQPAVADVLGRDRRSRRQRAAEQVGRDGPGRELPARRAGRGRRPAPAPSSSSANCCSACWRRSCVMRTPRAWQPGSRPRRTAARCRGRRARAAARRRVSGRSGSRRTRSPRGPRPPDDAWPSG